MLLLGHSQVPERLPELEDCLGFEVHIRRVPGAKAILFHQTPAFQEALAAESYHLVFIWLGSNDIRPGRSPKGIAAALSRIATQFRAKGSKVRVIKVEPRKFSRRRPLWRFMLEDYNKMRNGVNRKLYKIPGVTIMDLGSPYFNRNLGPDGVHYNAEGQRAVRKRIVKAIWQESSEWRPIYALGGSLTEEERFVPDEQL